MELFKTKEVHGWCSSKEEFIIKLQKRYKGYVIEEIVNTSKIGAMYRFVSLIRKTPFKKNDKINYL